MIQNNGKDSKPMVFQISSQCETAVYQSFLVRFSTLAIPDLIRPRRSFEMMR